MKTKITKVIAHRKTDIWLLLISAEVICLALLFSSKEVYQWVLITFLLALNTFECVQYFKLPDIIISLDEEFKLHLPKGIVLNPKDITDVSYRRVSAKAIQYKWGSITIKTATEEYKYKYVAECESIAKIITDIVYKSKSSNIDIFQ